MRTRGSDVSLQHLAKDVYIVLRVCAWIDIARIHCEIGGLLKKLSASDHMQDQVTHLQDSKTCTQCLMQGGIEE